MFDDLGGAVSYLIAVLMTPDEPSGFPNSTGQFLEHFHFIVELLDSM